eukprot:26974-Rhodomonas_salina.1
MKRGFFSLGDLTDAKAGKTMRLKDGKITFPSDEFEYNEDNGRPTTHKPGEVSSGMRMVYMESYPDVDKDGQIVSEATTKAILERERRERDEARQLEDDKRKGIKRTGKEGKKGPKNTKKKEPPSIPRMAGIYYDNVHCTWYSLNDMRRRKPVDGTLFYHPVLGRVVKCVSNKEFRENNDEETLIHELGGGSSPVETHPSALMIPSMVPSTESTRSAFDALPDVNGTICDEDGDW